jgi:[NiFe] hydrogenase diaphorase moiety large subunit
MDKFESLDTFIGQLCSGAGAEPGLLLQHLYEIQYRYSCIPAPAVALLAACLKLPVTRITGVIDFYSFLHHSPRGEFDILFSDSISDHMLGSRELLQRLCERLGVGKGTPRADGRVTIDTTSCTGICDQGPALLVNGWTVARLDTARIDAIADRVEAGIPVSGWPAEFFDIQDNIRRSDRLLTDTVAAGAALQALSLQGGAALLEAVERSGLRGRGGAGFRTATKWGFCRAAEAAERYVVCNADEGEPGTFKDRILLNSHADQVFEGMTLCAGIVGARKGYLYLRGEYRYLRAPLEAVLERRRAAGLLGASISGMQGFDFDIEIHMGAGAYICGEESALIESLEGRRGIPRIRPPFPVTHGYRGQPTVVNNVETFMAAAAIAVHGPGWFTAAGTPGSSGTKLLSVCGDCERPGIYEYPFGVTVTQVLADCGARDAQAVQIAGAAGATIPAAEFDRALAFEDIATGGSFMVFNSSRDMLDMVCNFARFFTHESCGFCTPCRVGGVLLRNLVEKVCEGRGGESDLQEMRGIGKLMQQASQCGLGTTASNHVLDTLEKFPDSYRRRLRQTGFEPAFDLDAALDEARAIAGRSDSGTTVKVPS